MELTYSKKKITLDREEFEVDRFALNFITHLDRAGIRYVVISGYVAISLGRSRNTEDVDMFVEKIPFGKFEEFWNSVSTEFECMNAASAKDAYHEYLLNSTAIRFSRKGKYIPNIEFKFAKTDLDRYSLDNALDLVLNGNPVRISPIELQIAYKAFLGTEKDIEDATYLYELLKGKLDLRLIHYFIPKLKISRSAIRKIGIPDENRP
ncbi:MAG: nucleotidyltransferase [Candidatus Micrarchaeota archaeon]